MKNIVSAFMLSLASVCVFGQMDSAHVDVFVSGTTPSPFNSSQELPLLKLSFFVDEFDYFGELYIEVADEQTKQVFYKIKITSAEITSQELMTNNQMEVSLMPLFHERKLLVSTLVKDFDGIIHRSYEHIIQ